MLRKAVDLEFKKKLGFKNVNILERPPYLYLAFTTDYKLPLIMIRYSYNSQSAASLRLNTTSQYSEELRDTGTRYSALTLTWTEPG